MAAGNMRNTLRVRDSIGRGIRDVIFGRGVVAVASALSLAVTTRVLGPSEFGVYTAATAFATLLLILTDLGSVTVVVREGLRSGRPAETSTTYIHVRLVLTVASIAVGAALVPIAFEEQQRGTAWLSLGLVAFGAAPLVAPLGQLHGSMRVFRRASWLHGALSCLSVIAAAAFLARPTPAAFVSANIFAAAIATVYALVGSRLYMTNLLSFDRRAVARMLRAITLLGFGAALSAMYARIDGVLLLRLGTAEDAGFYSAAYRFVDQAALIPAGIVAPLVPIVVAEIRDYGRLSVNVARELTRLATVAGVSFSALVTGLVFIAAPVLLGTSFDETTKIASLVVLFRSWTFVATFAYILLVNTGGERSYVAIALTGLVVNVFLNVVLIPSYGAYGSVVATLLTEAATLALYMRATRGVSGSDRTVGVAQIALGAAVIASGAYLAASWSVPARVALGAVLVLGGSTGLAAAARRASLSLAARNARVHEPSAVEGVPVP